MRLLIEFIITSVILVFVAKEGYAPGVSVDSYTTGFIVAIVLALVNATLGAVARLITFPLRILTLGLSSFLISIGLVYLVSMLVPGFEVNQFLGAVVLAIVVALVRSIFSSGKK